MSISMDDVKVLREKTGISLAECRKALEEGVTMEGALEYLRARSGAMAAKKADRELGSHTVASYVHPTGSMGVMVDVMCETDFVSQHEEIRQLVKDIAMQVASMNPRYITRADASEGAEAELVLMEQPFVKDGSFTVQELIAQKIQKFGENIVIAQMTRFGK